MRRNLLGDTAEKETVHRKEEPEQETDIADDKTDANLIKAGGTEDSDDAGNNEATNDNKLTELNENETQEIKGSGQETKVENTAHSEPKKKKKINLKNLLKNTTRSIGRGLRKTTNSDLVPMGNIKKRNFTITFEYNAPEFEKGDDIKHPKHTSGYRNNKILAGNTIAGYLKSGSGKTDGDRLEWNASGDYDPSKGEHIESFIKATLSYDSVADPDYFALINLTNKTRKTAVCTLTSLTGKLEMGPSKSGYEAEVQSLPGLTEAPNNSDWNYTVEIEMDVWVPYSEDVNGKDYEKKDVSPNKRPWWHKFWYGEKLPVKE
ncbi:MAG: hypothetical protein ACXVPQ_12455 [Bacteroidia bacterium]